MGLGLGGGLGTIVEESGLGLGQSHSEFIDEEEEFGLQLSPPAHYKQPHNMRLSEKIQRVSRFVVIITPQNINCSA